MYCFNYVQTRNQTDSFLFSYVSSASFLYLLHTNTIRRGMDVMGSNLVSSSYFSVFDTCWHSFMRHASYQSPPHPSTHPYAVPHRDEHVHDKWIVLTLRKLAATSWSLRSFLSRTEATNFLTAAHGRSSRQSSSRSLKPWFSLLAFIDMALSHPGKQEKKKRCHSNSTPTVKGYTWHHLLHRRCFDRSHMIT